MHIEVNLIYRVHTKTKADSSPLEYIKDYNKRRLPFVSMKKKNKILVKKLKIYTTRTIVETCRENNKINPPSEVKFLNFNKFLIFILLMLHFLIS